MVCRMCGEDKPASAFYVSQKSRCKECVKAKVNGYRADHRAEINAAARTKYQQTRLLAQPAPRGHDLTGRVFGQLSVVQRATEGHGKVVYWQCRCTCGQEKAIAAHSLLSGSSRSCGCQRAQAQASKLRTHGATGTPTYRSWLSMRHRCTDPARAYYHGRGITVCARWASFEAFLADMGPRPGPAYTLERLDNAGDYEPGNVVWATALEQGSNKRSNHLITFKERTMTVSAWARETGLFAQVISNRLKRGWSAERALTTPTSQGARP